ncbi:MULTISPECIES: aminotransferase class V-fold PLP-dependent enzyme [unclassified Streptomyces]|uniref:aminotransferase class V-fold PLP-dependent enzyme n=1 Tax=unclassified Streptomyces TaxID=2593676 RepID=UPI000BAC7CE5|nr:MULTISPECIES: aminotransferase class V-fold PLP-dependent enzyme [unclassified Streptomyces]ASY31569.1 cysteine desulfurase [Streptomyces sp. CLI2509]MYX24465.1 aminotransferase class V-fold PLP-dependent enzyme [Streptomyces sp. SID8380]
MTEDNDRWEELAAWQREIRAEFPILAAEPHLAYLDSAATAQKPRAVLDAVTAYLTTSNANAARGTYPWANRTTRMIEEVRERVKSFLGDPEPARSRVHFTSGTSEGLRTIARDWLPGYLRDGDEIVVPFADHEANTSPWLEARDLLAARGVRITVHEMPVQSGSGDYDLTALAALLTPRTRFLALTHVHHVYGADMNVHRVRELAGDDVVLCLDAAQSVGHLPISLAALDVDFLVFSGHKALALPGTGAVWSREARGAPLVPGGWDGTPNTAGIVSLGAALAWLEGAGLDRIERWTRGLAERLTDGLSALPAYEVLGCPLSLARGTRVQQRQSIVTFRHRDIESVDLGFILFSEGFMIRADGLCQASGGEKRSSVRVSLHVYNTFEEIDRLLVTLRGLTSS